MHQHQRRQRKSNAPPRHLLARARTGVTSCPGGQTTNPPQNLLARNLLSSYWSAAMRICLWDKYGSFERLLAEKKKIALCTHKKIR